MLRASDTGHSRGMHRGTTTYTPDGCWQRQCIRRVTPITPGGVVSSSRRSPRFIVAVFLMLSPMAVAIAQSSVAISPFVSYVPSAATNPLAGMALTFGGTTGLALRGSADLSVSNPEKTTTTTGEASGG